MKAKQKVESRKQKFIPRAGLSLSRALCALTFISAFCFPDFCFSADRITATVTVTNAPTTNGMTFVVNADTRTWYDSVTNPATQILTNATVTGATTNLYNHLLSTPPTAVTPYLTASNTIRLDARTGSPLTVSGAGVYFSVTYSTQTVSVAYDLSIPYTATPSALRPTMTAGLVDWLNLTSARAIYENSPAVANLVGRTNSQTISGNKTFTGTILISNRAGIFEIGTISATNLNGIIGAISNGIWYEADLVNPSLMNGQNFGNPFRSPGSGSQSEQFGTAAAADGIASVAFGDLAAASENYAIALGYSAHGSAVGGVAVGAGADVETDYGAAYGYNATVAATHTNSSAFGVGATTTAKHQIRLGTADEHVSIPGHLQHFTAEGTNDFPAGADLAFGRYAVTSLANGNNAAVPIGTNVFVEVSGPTGAFTINGINGSPNRDGKLVILINQTGQDMTIAHQSGTDPTAANRIITMTGADRATTANGSATLIYSAAASRWILIAFDP